MSGYRVWHVIVGRLGYVSRLIDGKPVLIPCRVLNFTAGPDGADTLVQLTATRGEYVRGQWLHVRRQYVFPRVHQETGERAPLFRTAVSWNLAGLTEYWAPDHHGSDNLVRIY